MEETPAFSPSWASEFQVGAQLGETSEKGLLGSVEPLKSVSTLSSWRTPTHPSKPSSSITCPVKKAFPENVQSQLLSFLCVSACGTGTWR